MRIYLIIVILLFNLFFFIRAFLLSKSLGQNIKAKNLLLHLAIFFAGSASILFLLYLVLPRFYFFWFKIFQSSVLEMIGAILITGGIVFSSIASLSLKNSWRIGFDRSEKTELITNGIYGLSRNPYFLAYDFVLLGMVYYSLSLLIMVPVLLTIILFHLMILKEEQFLEQTHGDIYIDYKNKVRRYI
ncbi:MAG: isoprenylcysteine carboxylmethyltransferase family protein [Spirochaetes bacterium]|nr:isoprenylcysteine carboxylmethyltransferase family protein [Spirochaetota bacterium]